MKVNKAVLIQTKPHFPSEMAYANNLTRFIAAVREAKRWSKDWQGMRLMKPNKYSNYPEYVHKSTADHCAKMRAYKGLKQALTQDKI